MKGIAYLIVVWACAAFHATAAGQTSSDLKKYPDIAYRLRAFQLFEFLPADIQAEKGLKAAGAEFQRMDRAVTVISLELNEAGLFMALDKPLPSERLERLSPAARVFYEYYRQALSHNPILADVYKPLPAARNRLYASYRTYQLEGRPESERRAYEAAINVLVEIGTVAPSRFPWAWATVGLLAPLMAAGTFALYRRRRDISISTATSNDPRFHHKEMQERRRQ